MGASSYETRKSFSQVLTDEINRNNLELVEHVVLPSRRESNEIEAAISYAAVKNSSTGKTFGLITIFKRFDIGNTRQEVWFKFIEESEGPYYYSCPVGIINKLSPTQDELSIKWRNKCMQKS